MIKSAKEFKISWEKIKLAMKVIKTYKNWGDVFLTYLRLKNSKAFKLKNGLKIVTDNGPSAIDAINEIFIRDAYITPMNINESLLILDIGANIGVGSVYFANKFKNSKIYSYEPSAVCFNYLKKNISNNGFDNQIIPLKKAIMGKSGRIKMYIDPLNSQLNNAYAPTENMSEIDAVTLSQIFKNRKIKECDFLKMDCEGAEFEIIYNTPKSILNKIKTIVLEYHDYIGVGKGSELAGYLSRNGFRVRKKGGSVGYIYAVRTGLKNPVLK